MLIQQICFTDSVQTLSLFSALHFPPLLLYVCHFCSDSDEMPPSFLFRNTVFCTNKLIKKETHSVFLAKSDCMWLVYMVYHAEACLQRHHWKRNLSQNASLPKRQCKLPDATDANASMCYCCAYLKKWNFITSRCTCSLLPAESFQALFLQYKRKTGGVLTSFKSFSVNKEEVPDNEQEKGTEKEMTERVSEDTEMVRCTWYCLCNQPLHIQYIGNALR